MERVRKRMEGGREKEGLMFNSEDEGHILVVVSAHLLERIGPVNSRDTTPNRSCE